MVEDRLFKSLQNRYMILAGGVVYSGFTQQGWAGHEVPCLEGFHVI
jgi:hypothetical protein